ncbi:MAG: MFS transporter [Oscillospiraceae bacterium]|nr:MFS transporter [Oscillospiraceae bacterium]
MDNLKNFNEGVKNFSFKDDMPDIGGDNNLNISQGKSVSIEQLLSTPGPERDRFVVAFIEGRSPEEREEVAFLYRLAPEAALRRWYATGDLVAGEALVNHLFYSQSNVDKEEARRIAKELFPKRPSAEVAYVQLASENEGELKSKQYSWNEVVQIGETAIDYELERGIEKKEGSGLMFHGGVCVLLSAAYRGEAQPLLKYDKYGRSCRAETDAAEKIDKINKSDAAGMGYSIVELIFSLYCLGVSLWFLPAGSEFLGNWFGLVPLIVGALFMWAVTGSLVGGVISGAVVYGIAWALTYWVNAPFNASMLPVALIGVLFLWSAFSDIHTSIKWKRGQPERDRQAAEQKRIAQRELAFRKNFCQRRLDLCRKLDEDKELNNLKDAWKEFKQVYQNELNEVKKEAERLHVAI